MSSLFSLGEPYKSAEEASKSKQSILLGLCLLAAIQVAGALFFWWISKFDNSISQNLPTPHLDILLLLIFGLFLYLYNSRVVASGLLAFATLELLVIWYLKITTIGSFTTPPGMALILLGVAGQIAMVVFKTHEWIQKGNAKPSRSKWVKRALISTLVFAIGGYFYPAFDFINHTRYQVSVTEKGDLVEYYEPADKYSLEFPNTWDFEHPSMEYGNIDLARKDNKNVSVQVERWQPRNIAPVALFQRGAFLKIAQDEAVAYSEENGAAVETVEMTGSENVNEVRVIYKHADGSKRHVYYIYNKAWGRQTSHAAYFFWRLTADISSDSLRFEKEVEAILNSFKVVQ